MRKTLWLLGCLVVLNPFAVAAGANDATTTEPEATATPALFVQDLGNRALAVVTDKSLTQEQRVDHYRTLLRESFDLATIGRFVIGRAWAQATPEQRATYSELFEALVVKIYGDRLALAPGASFGVRAARPESDHDFIVASEVQRAQGPPVRIDWRVRQKGDRYAILDVVVDGVSLSVTQRQEYTAIIQKSGGVEGLLDRMRQRLNTPAAPQPG